jgi:hypothetical protein
MICRNCGTTNAESALFCQQCDKELFLANKSMDIVLGKETPSNKQQILKELILNLNHLSKRAEKENSREQLIFLFQNDLIGYAGDAFEAEVYLYPAFSEALVKTAKIICNKI